MVGLVPFVFVSPFFIYIKIFFYIIFIFFFFYILYFCCCCCCTLFQQRWSGCVSFSFHIGGCTELIRSLRIVTLLRLAAFNFYVKFIQIAKMPAKLRIYFPCTKLPRGSNTQRGCRPTSPGLVEKM